MRYHALATDYDGTIAAHGHVSEETLQALQELKASGRKLILVTGRELPDLFSVFSEPELFDRIVAENGALLYRPDTKEERILREPPKPAFVDLLRERGVRPLSVGRVIVATTEPNETWVLQAIRDLGLELQVIFNKGAVMILPSGVNKATGLDEALGELHLSRHNVVCVGDAENDHAFLEYAECSAAVANALPALKDRADLVLSQSHGGGVTELIQQLLADDLKSAAPKLARHEFVLGFGLDGAEVRIPPCGENLLLAGVAELTADLLKRFLNQLVEQQYQTCILDPSGAYADLKSAITLGDNHRRPSFEDIMQGLDQPKANVVVNWAALDREEQAAALRRLVSGFRDLHAGTGRPHWLIVDQAESLVLAGNPWPNELSSTLFVTSQPKQLSSEVLSASDWIIASGLRPQQTLREIWARLGLSSLPLPFGEEENQPLGWRRHPSAVFRLESSQPGVAEHLAATR